MSATETTRIRLEDDLKTYVDDSGAGFGDNGYRFQFGAYACTQIHVWADSWESGFEQAAEYLNEIAPGYFYEPDYTEAATDLGLSEAWERFTSGPTDCDREDERSGLKVMEHAEMDLMRTESGFLPSWECHGREATEAENLEALRASVEARIVGAMRPVVCSGDWTTYEDEFCEARTIPAEYFSSSPEYTEVETESGFCSRLSMPGYLDCTDWHGPFATEAEALRALLESYAD